MTCLFIASKLEETVKKLHDVLPIVYPVLNGDEPTDPSVFDEYKKRILEYEKIILETCRFRFDIVHPHETMLKIIKQLKGNKEFGWRCWQLLGISYESALCILYPPKIIAVGVIYLGCLLQGDKAPFNPKIFEINGQVWFRNYASLEQVEDVMFHVLTVAITDLNDPHIEAYKDTLAAINKARMTRKAANILPVTRLSSGFNQPPSVRHTSGRTFQEPQQSSSRSVTPATSSRQSVTPPRNPNWNNHRQSPQQQFERRGRSRSPPPRRVYNDRDFSPRRIDDRSAHQRRNYHQNRRYNQDPPIQHQQYRQREQFIRRPPPRPRSRSRNRWDDNNGYYRGSRDDSPSPDRNRNRRNQLRPANMDYSYESRNRLSNSQRSRSPQDFKRKRY